MEAQEENTLWEPPTPNSKLFKVAYKIILCCACFYNRDAMAGYCSKPLNSPVGSYTIFHHPWMSNALIYYPKPVGLMNRANIREVYYLLT